MLYPLFRALHNGYTVKQVISYLPCRQLSVNNPFRWWFSFYDSRSHSSGIIANVKTKVLISDWTKFKLRPVFEYVESLRKLLSYFIKILHLIAYLAKHKTDLAPTDLGWVVAVFHCMKSHSEDFYATQIELRYSSNNYALLRGKLGYWFRNIVKISRFQHYLTSSNQGCINI